jgi:curved DNA-binding protein CbpA
VADAYYVLSDTKRRREYDILYKTRRDKTTDPGPSSRLGTADGARPNPEGVFADVLDEVRPPLITRSVFNLDFSSS